MTLGLRPRPDGLERYGLVNKTDRKISLLPDKAVCKSEHGIDYAAKEPLSKPPVGGASVLASRAECSVFLQARLAGTLAPPGFERTSNASMKMNITMGRRCKRATLALFYVLVVISPQAAIVSKLVIGAITGAANAMTNPNP